MANDKSETLTAIKTPVHLFEDVHDEYSVYRLMEANGDILFNGMLGRYHPVELLLKERDRLAHIGLCINEHESLANELRETKAKLADAVTALEGWVGWWNGPAQEGVSYIDPPMRRTRETLAKINAMTKTPRLESGEEVEITR